MNFLILDTYYPQVLESTYATHPQLLDWSFQKHCNFLLSLAFGTADFYSRNLKVLGYSTQDIILNAKSLQEKWEKENLLNSLLASFNLNWMERIAAKQISLYKPNVIYCQNLSMPGSYFLRKNRGKVKLVIGQVASPIVFGKEYLSGYDLIITSFPHFVNKFRKIGIKCEYLPLAFEHTLLSRLIQKTKKYDSVFVGRNTVAHKGALDTFAYLAKRVKFDIWGLGWESLGKSYHLEPAWGFPMFKIYRQAKIVVNRHIDVAENYANNLRLFESTGVGTMLITDHKDNLGELFVPGKEVETYNTKEELADKVKFYLKNSNAREKIAKAGQRRTLTDHIYKKRMKELDRIIKKYL